MNAFMSLRSTNQYHAKWLPRARRLLAPSGRLSELSHILSTQTEASAEVWRQHLQKVLAGEEQADPDLIFYIENFLAKPAKTTSTEVTDEFQLDF